MLLYSSGDCSDPTNPSNDCCRITCESCFVNMSIASIYADVDVYPGTFDYMYSTQAKLVGNSAIKVKVVSPTGCKLASTTFKSFNITPLSIPLGTTGLFLEVGFSAAIVGELAIKPHGTSIEVGITTQIQSLTAGSVNFSDFVDKQIVFQGGEDITKSGVDVSVELSVAPTIKASLVFLELTRVGIQAGIPFFVRLESGIKYPEPFAALTTPYLDASSKYRGGDCMKPHFMEYRGLYGYKAVQITLFVTIVIPLIKDPYYEKPLAQNGSEHSRVLFSGCISSKYDAMMQLTTAANAVTTATVDRVTTALQKVLMWALKLPDVDPNFLKLTFLPSGQISISLAVPPSVADKYPTPSELQTQFYQVARTDSFADAVSSFVGLNIVAQCDTGYWGSACLNLCASPNCDGVACNAATGVVTSCTSCSQGYWGSPICSNTCSSPQNCRAGSVSCDFNRGSVVSCSGCNRGWYGTTSSTQCSSPHCATGSVSCNSVDGSVNSCSSCETGWWGQTCTNQCTSLHCKTGYVDCDSRGDVISCSQCEDGWWGQTCNNACSSPRCRPDYITCKPGDGAVTSCSSCNTGYWGYPTCDNTCASLHCSAGSASCNYQGNVVSCDSCETGWWGRTCSDQCSAPYCSDNTVSCDSNNGTVFNCSSCIDGYYGPACMNECELPQHCENSICEPLKGGDLECISCEDGYYGATCEHACNLTEHCQASRCEQQSGEHVECLNCDDGYYGLTCEIECSVPDHCNGSKCDPHSGEVTECLSCTTGWWDADDMCRRQCFSSHCVAGSVACNADDGVVSSCDSCDDGWWGAICDNQCSSLNCVADFVSCNGIDGTVTSCSGCEDGYWGQLCENTCELQEHCKSTRCAQSTGTEFECTECNNGWEGSLCDSNSTTTGSASATTGTIRNTARPQHRQGFVAAWLSNLIACMLFQMM